MFYRALDAKDFRLRNLALLALARLHPRPVEAKQALLKSAGRLNSEEKLGIFRFALDDPDFLAIFSEYLEGADVDEQRRAADVLVQAGPLAAPAVDILRRLQRRPHLDERVAASIKTAIKQIERAK